MGSLRARIGNSSVRRGGLIESEGGDLEGHSGELDLSSELGCQHWEPEGQNAKLEGALGSEVHKGDLEGQNGALEGNNWELESGRSAQGA